MASQLESPPGPTPISPGWLWALRVLTVLFAVGIGALAVRTYLDSDAIDAWVLAYLPFLAGYGLILWHLGRNPPGKLGLAVALGMGGIMFVILVPLALLALSELMPGYEAGTRKEGLIWSGSSMIGVLAMAAYSACAIRIYYLLPREEHDRRTLFSGLARVGLICIIFAIVFPNLLRRVAPGQASPVGSLRTILSAEINYSSTYNRGYSSSLRELDFPANGEQPSASAAGQIDSILASGTKSGYVFTYIPGPRVEGRIDSFTLTARPLKYERGDRNFYTDNSGVIRATDEDRPATAQDPPLGG